MSQAKELTQVQETNSGSRIKDLREAGVRQGLWRRGDKFIHYCRGQLFRGIDLKDKTVLDVGCGDGLYLMWAGVHGAARMVGLEPLLDGSGATKKSDLIFYGMSEALNLKNIERQPVTFQEFQCEDGTFDVVLLHASINHLDEEMCIELQENPEARAIYLEIFRKLRRIMKKGGKLIVVDASNRNFFGDLGMKHIKFRKLAFHKHQSPEFWSDLLLMAGFDAPRIRWVSNPEWGPFAFFLRNRTASYFLESTFRLVMSAM